MIVTVGGVMTVVDNWALAAEVEVVEPGVAAVTVALLAMLPLNTAPLATVATTSRMTVPGAATSVTVPSLKIFVLPVPADTVTAGRLGRPARFVAESTLADWNTSPAGRTSVKLRVWVPTPRTAIRS